MVYISSNSHLARAIVGKLFMSFKKFKNKFPVQLYPDHGQGQQEWKTPPKAVILPSNNFFANLMVKPLGNLIKASTECLVYNMTTYNYTTASQKHVERQKFVWKSLGNVLRWC